MIINVNQFENSPEWLSRHLRNAEIVLASGDLSPALKETLKHFYQGIRDNFTSSVAPDGSQWPERKHIGDGHPLLIDKGRMMQAALGNSGESILEVQPREMVLGVKSSVNYAGIHNYGTARMPKREFMGTQETKLEEIDEIMADELYELVFGHGGTD